MLQRVIEWSARNIFIVLLASGLIVAAGVYALVKTPLDALPDLSDVQVIVFTDYPGQAPQVVEDQVTYPLATAMLAVPRSKVVRGFSFFGASFVYIIFEDGTDLYWARSRVLEYLNFAAGRLPPSVTPSLGPDATGVGWVYEYALEDPTSRYLMTTFALGCNLGYAQTVNHFPKAKISADSLSFVNRRHITVDSLRQANRRIAEVYFQLQLPKAWGIGESVSGDGSHVETYEENLQAGFHFRYRQKGLIAYRLVCDNYIAIFQTFIPPGMHEANYVLDGLMKAGLSLEPDTVYSDTHGQSSAVFCFAHTAGIKLYPRIRNWHDLTFHRPSKGIRYQHVDSLFRGDIDWDLISAHWKDVMQVALSVYVGRTSSPVLLRKLGSHSRRNKLFFAAQEIGNAKRTAHLAKWLMDPAFRRTITAGCNKQESYHDFQDFFNFGGDLLPVNEHDEQQKRLLYNDLVASCAILQNAIDMETAIEQLKAEKYPVKESDFDYFSPYPTKHIKRFGNYDIKLNRPSEPWIRDAKFQDAVQAADRQQRIEKRAEESRWRLSK